MVLGSPVNLLRSTHNRNKYRIYGKRARYEVTDGRNQRRLLLWILSNRAPLLPPTPSPPLPSPPLPPPDGSVFIAVRRDARSNPRGRSIYLLLLLLATGIDPIDRQQPAVFIFIGIVDSTEKKKKKKKPAKLQQQPTYIEAMHVPSSRP